MKISEIKRQKKNPNRVSVYIEGKYSFSLDYDTLMASHLHVGDAVTDEKRNDLLQNDEFPRARDYAYTLLSYRASSNSFPGLNFSSHTSSMIEPFILLLMSSCTTLILPIGLLKKISSTHLRAN